MRKTSRRSFLTQSLVFGTAAFSGPASASRAAAGLLQVTRADSSAAFLRAIIEINGKQLIFEESAGKELGDFTAPRGGFVQRCVKTTLPEHAFTVFFRPDRGSERAEVVVEYGRLWSGTPNTLGPYKVTILRGSATLATINVPSHGWRARWRWASQPRPIVGRVDELKRTGLLPPYGQPPVGYMPRSGRPRYPEYAIMGLAGLTAYQPTTGERMEIGPLPEPVAEWVCTGDEDARRAMLALAEASGTMPWHFRDERTGGPINLDLHPKAGIYDEHINTPFIPMAKSDIVFDNAHQPSLAYLPYLLTDDPYYLEELQFAAATSNLGDPEYRRDSAMIITNLQVRSLAWMARTMAHAAVATPDSVPRWLLPRSYWRQKLENNRLWCEETFVKSRSPERAIFHLADDFDGRQDGRVPAGTFDAPWQDEFFAAMCWWITLMGFEAWRPIAEWSTASTIARTSGKSGWQRSYSTPYRLMLRPERKAPWVTSWRAAWELNKKVQLWRDLPDNEWYDSDQTYLRYSRGVLVMAVRHNIPGAAACLAWADGILKDSRHPLPYKWSFVP